MRTLYTIAALFVLGSFLISSSSCNKKDECEYPNLTEGEISGSVLLFDDFQGALDKSGMAVTVLYSDPLLIDTTDSNGNYSFSNLPFGNYTLSYSKEGYGTYFSTVAHLNDCKLVTEVPVFYLGKRSTTTISSFSAEVVAVHVDFDVTINPAGSTEQARYFRIFFKNQNDVSSSSYDVDSGILFTESNAITMSLSVGDLHSLGFNSGDNIYAKVYGESYYSNEYYDADLTNPHTVFPNLNIVTVPDVDFVVP